MMGKKKLIKIISNALPFLGKKHSDKLYDLCNRMVLKSTLCGSAQEPACFFFEVVIRESFRDHRPSFHYCVVPFMRITDLLSEITEGALLLRSM